MSDATVVQLTCPSCQKQVRVRAEPEGRKVRCKSCGALIKVPMSLANDAEDAEVPPRRAPKQRPAKKASRSTEGRPKRSSRTLIWICGLATGALILIVCTVGVVLIFFSNTPNKKIVGKWQSKDDPNRYLSLRR
jgi:predicted Zn finger-like uncharacterized protein